MKFHVPLLDSVSSKTKLKIIKFFLSHDALMSEREIASILKVSHMSINRTMRELADMNFVNFVNAGKAHLWRVNLKSYAFKVFSELLKKDPLNDLKEVILENLPKTLVKKAILFGSIAKGSEKTNSDIDVCFLVKNEKDKGKLEFSIDKLSNICLEAYGNRFSTYILTEQEMKKKKGLRIISEINKGIQIL